MTRNGIFSGVFYYAFWYVLVYFIKNFQTDISVTHSNLSNLRQVLMTFFILLAFRTELKVKQ